MSFQYDSPKLHQNIDEITIQKVSSLVTRFHAVLLPKANKTGIYRDLSEEQQYLLTNLDSENPLHSILAGCLAIDSCLSSISQFEQNLTGKIFKSIIKICEFNQMCKIEISDSPASTNTSMNKIQELTKQIEEASRNLLVLCQDLPFGDQQQPVMKQQKGLGEQDVTFKFTDGNLKKSEILLQLQEENLKLKQQLQFADKKAMQLELKLSKKQMGKSQFHFQEAKGQRKYSQFDKEDAQVQNKWIQPNSPTNSQAFNYQIQHLKEQIRQYEKVLCKMREDNNQERKSFMIEIRKLEDELRYSDTSQDRQTAYILQELEEELQFLREQRRHDGRVISQVVQKLEGLSVFRQNNKPHNFRYREGRSNLKLSTLKNSRLNVNDETNQTENRSHSFKRYRSRDRLHTIHNDQVQKSSTSIPKIQPILKNNNFNPILKYSKLSKNQQRVQNNSPQVRFEHNYNQRDIYQVPLAQSKIGPQSFLKYQHKSPENQSKPNGVHKSPEAYKIKFQMNGGHELIANRKQKKW